MKVTSNAPDAGTRWVTVERVEGVSTPTTRSLPATDPKPVPVRLKTAAAGLG